MDKWIKITSKSWSCISRYKNTKTYEYNNDKLTNYINLDRVSNISKGRNTINIMIDNSDLEDYEYHFENSETRDKYFENIIKILKVIDIDEIVKESE